MDIVKLFQNGEKCARLNTSEDDDLPFPQAQQFSSGKFKYTPNVHWLPGVKVPSAHALKMTSYSKQLHPLLVGLFE